MSVEVKKHTDSTFLVKTSKDQEFTAKPRVYEIIVRANDNDVKKSNVICKNLETGDILFMESLDKIKVNGSSFETPEALTSELSPLVFNIGGGSGSGTSVVSKECDLTCVKKYFSENILDIINEIKNENNLSKYIYILFLGGNGGQVLPFIYVRQDDEIKKLNHSSSVGISFYFADGKRIYFSSDDYKDKYIAISSDSYNFVPFGKGFEGMEMNVENGMVITFKEILSDKELRAGKLKVIFDNSINKLYYNVGTEILTDINSDIEYDVYREENFVNFSGVISTPTMIVVRDTSNNILTSYKVSDEDKGDVNFSLSFESNDTEFNLETIHKKEAIEILSEDNVKLFSPYKLNGDIVDNGSFDMFIKDGDVVEIEGRNFDNMYVTYIDGNIYYLGKNPETGEVIDFSYTFTSSYFEKIIFNKYNYTDIGFDPSARRKGVIITINDNDKDLNINHNIYGEAGGSATEIIFDLGEGEAMTINKDSDNFNHYLSFDKPEYNLTDNDSITIRYEDLEQPVTRIEYQTLVSQTIKVMIVARSSSKGYPLPYRLIKGPHNISPVSNEVLNERGLGSILMNPEWTIAFDPGMFNGLYNSETHNIEGLSRDGKHRLDNNYITFVSYDDFDTSSSTRHSLIFDITENEK